MCMWCVCVCECVYVWCVCVLVYIRHKSFVLYIQHIKRRINVLFTIFTCCGRDGLWSRDESASNILPLHPSNNPTFHPLARSSGSSAPYPCHWIKSAVLVYVIANISFRWMSGVSRCVTSLDCALSDVSCQGPAAPQTSRRRKWHAWFTFYRSRDLILAAGSLVPRWKWQDTGCPFYSVPEHRSYNAKQVGTSRDSCRIQRWDKRNTVPQTEQSCFFQMVSNSLYPNSGTHKFSK